MSALTLIIVFFIGTTIIDIVRNKKKSSYKKTYKKKTYGSVDIHNQMKISQEPRRIAEYKSTYTMPENKIYEHSDSLQSEDKSAIKWDKAFLKSLEWKRFEEVCMEYLRIKNCAASVTSIGADGGIDIKIHDSNGSLFAVAQCKSWSKPIGVSLVRELYGVMASEKAKYGIFLTTSTFTPDALEFTKEKLLLLIDADEFVKLVNSLNDTDKRRIDQVATAGDYTTPTCVQCNIKMVKRTATKGRNAGNSFWGCKNYPKCKNVMFVRN